VIVQAEKLFTVTVNVQLELPEVHVTVVVPTGKLDPDEGLQVAWLPEQSLGVL
jgi:hypothetical protein